jgi:hypothetical protein
MIIKILEFTRLAGVIAGYFVSYFLFDTPEEMLKSLTIWTVVSIAGLSGLEGLLFSKQAAKDKGYEQGSNYQIQSACAFLSLAIIAILVVALNWGTKAYLTISFAFLLFVFMSTINHAYQAIVKKNFKWNNIIRPFQTVFLIAIYIYPVVKVLS